MPITPTGVDERDLMVVVEHLGATDRPGIEEGDLNDDDVVDVIDAEAVIRGMSVNPAE